MNDERDPYLEDFADGIFGGYKTKYLELGAEYLNFIFNANRQQLYSQICNRFRNEGFKILRNSDGQHKIEEEYD